MCSLATNIGLKGGPRQKNSFRTVILMATTATGEGISATETPLLNDVVPGSIDFKGRPSVRSKSGCWKSASFIVGFEMAERFCLYGISSNLVSYLTGPLGQSTAAAAANWNAWFGTAALSPILGALLADSFLGRYRMIIFSSLLYISGLGFLTLSSALNSFSFGCKSAANTCSPSQLRTIFFFFSLYLLALAQGGHKPCLQAFGADQFDLGDRKESKAKSSFFNWFFWFSCLGKVLALSVLDYIQENLSWELGFGIPSIVMCFALIVFWIGTLTYRFNINRNGRHPFPRISRGFVEAATNSQPGFAAQQVLPQECAQLEFQDRALLAPDVSIEDDKMCTIEEAKAILRLAPLWCTSLPSLGYSIVYAQPSTLFTKQAATMDRHIGSSFQIPAASLQLCISVSIMVFISIYDRICVPVARSISKNPSGISKLQRIGIGLLLSLVSIVLAAVVEKKRLSTACEYGLLDVATAMIPMSVWWLAPQYLLSGISDVFCMVGLQEFFYDQVPSKLKSTGLALYFSIFGIGSLLSSFLVSVIQNATSRNGEEGWFSDNLNRAHLDYFYWLLAGLSVFLLAAYVYFAKCYAYSRRITV